MKKGYGKQKGSQYERDVCRRLSLWISENKNPNLFWRSAMSGGRSTLALKRGGINKEQSGDISSVSEEGHTLIDQFYIECKNYTDLGIDNFLVGKSSKLTSFWKETCTAAKKNDKLPMLVAKQSYFPELIILSLSGIREMLFKEMFPHTRIYTGVNGNEVIVALFDDFLKACKLIANMKLPKKELDNAAL
jgi:hypothetical protein